MARHNGYTFRRGMCFRATFAPVRRSFTNFLANVAGSRAYRANGLDGRYTIRYSRRHVAFTANKATSRTNNGYVRRSRRCLS